MTTDDLGVHISHSGFVLLPKPTPSYAIDCDDWDRLKEQLYKVGKQKNPWYPICSLAVGVSLSTLVSILTRGIGQTEVPIAWAVVVISGAVALLTLWSGYRVGAQERAGVNEILRQMQSIELRYPERSAIAAVQSSLTLEVRNQ